MLSDYLFQCPIGFLLFFMRVWRSHIRSPEGEVVEKWHPQLPAEKKLIIYSLIAAAVLLVVLVWVSYTYFRVGE